MFIAQNIDKKNFFKIKNYEILFKRTLNAIDYKYKMNISNFIYEINDFISSGTYKITNCDECTFYISEKLNNLGIKSQPIRPMTLHINLNNNNTAYDLNKKHITKIKKNISEKKEKDIETEKKYIKEYKIKKNKPKNTKVIFKDDINILDML